MNTQPIIAIAGAALLAALVPQADDKESIGLGRAIYLKNCASCHGPDARGTGTALGVEHKEKVVAVPDLTTIESRDGIFEPLHVARHIEGSDRGWWDPCTSGMPCWQHLMSERRGAANARLQVLNLLNYLRSIQKTPAK